MQMFLPQRTGNHLLTKMREWPSVSCKPCLLCYDVFRIAAFFQQHVLVRACVLWKLSRAAGHAGQPAQRCVCRGPWSTWRSRSHAVLQPPPAGDNGAIDRACATFSFPTGSQERSCAWSRIGGMGDERRSHRDTRIAAVSRVSPPSSTPTFRGLKQPSNNKYKNSQHWKCHPLL